MFGWMLASCVQVPEDTYGPLDLELQVSEPSYIGARNPINVLEEQQDTLRHESLFRSVGSK